LVVLVVVVLRGGIILHVSPLATQRGAAKQQQLRNNLHINKT